MDYKEIIKVIDDLNSELGKKTNYDGFQQFTLSTNGYQDLIYFQDEVLWNSDEDDREFFEEKGEYEPLILFVKKEFNNYVTRLQKLKFKRIK